jgi:uncharacterized protein (TIGR02453 family)
MARFEGFVDDDARFFKALAKNNNREWFVKHKVEYEEGWAVPMKALLEEVAATVDKHFPYVDLEEPRQFRIYRNLRFSRDKTPYKDHVAGILPTHRTGRGITDLPFALYFYVGATERFGGAGHYMMGPDSLARFRTAVADDKRGKELVKLVTALERKGYERHPHGALARVPKGFPPDHPRADYLKMKGLTVGFPRLPKGILTSRKLVPWLVDKCKTAAPFVTWLATA